MTATMLIMMRVTTFFIAVSFLLRIDFAEGQSMDVTESTVLANHAADYEYENINAGIVTSNNISVGNDTKQADINDGGLFYPLYGEAIKRLKESSDHEPQGTSHSSLAMPPTSNDSTPSAALDYSDYTGIEEPPSPQRGVETQKPWNGPPGQNNFNTWMGENGEEGVGGIFREGHHALIGEGPWRQKAVRMGKSEWMWGGDMMETLRKEFQIIRHYKLIDRLDELQFMYPYVNVTRLYTLYKQQSIGDRLLYGGMDNRDSSNGYWYNGSFQYYDNAFDFEADDGFWHNGTFYPLMEQETEDGFWFNGTFYAGESEGPDLEDGYFYNGSFYYTGETEGPDLEDGFFHNGTFYPGMPEEQDEGRGWYEGEDLMWWQLHHPRWRDRGIEAGQPWNQWGVRGEDQPPHHLSSSPYRPKGFPVYGRHHIPPWADNPRHKSIPKPFPANPSKPNTMDTSKLMEHIFSRPQRINNQGASQNRNGQASKVQQSFKQNQPNSRMYPMRQGMPLAQPQRTFPSETITQMRDRYRAFQRQRQSMFIKHPMRQNRPLAPPSANNQRTISQNSKGSQSGFLAGQLTDSQGAKSQALTFSGRHNSNAAGNEGPTIFKKTNPLDPYSDTSTMVIGITFACVLGLMLIIAPLCCMLYTYRQNKKMKKRTLLRRPELSGSVDEDLVDAMVRTELGAVGRAKHPISPSENSARGGSASFIVNAKSRGAEPTEKRWKERKRWSMGRSGKKSQDVEKYERGGRGSIEMAEMGNTKRNRPLPARPDQPSPPSMRSSFLYHHSRYAPRNNGTVEGEQQQRLLSRPMSIVGMDSEDEVQVIGKQN